MRPSIAAVLFLGLQAALAVALLLFSPRDPNFFFREAVEKCEQTRRTPAPRVLLWGGSSVALGTYSPLVEERTGMPTINWGLHADLGLAAFWLKRFESLLSPGDVVVVSIEYGGLHRGGRPVGITIAELLDVDHSLVLNLSCEEAKAVLDDGLSFFRVLLLRVIHGTVHFGGDRRLGIYRADATNRWGDSVAHWNKRPTYRVKKGETLIPQGASHVNEAIDRLNAFAASCRDLGVTTLFFYPAVPEALLRSSRNEIAALYSKLQTRLEMPSLNEPFEMGYPESWFFDTAYHLTREGTMHRTRLLADRLASWLASHRGHGTRSRTHDQR